MSSSFASTALMSSVVFSHNAKDIITKLIQNRANADANTAHPIAFSSSGQFFISCLLR